MNKNNIEEDMDNTSQNEIAMVNKLQELVLQEVNRDARLSFNDRIREKIGNAMKGVGLLCRFQYFLPRSCLRTIYKSFIRLHLDYGDVKLHQFNTMLH